MITLGNSSVAMGKDIHLNHAFNGDKTVAIVFLADSIALNSFTGGDNGCPHHGCIFDIECHVIHQCSILCIRGLQKLLVHQTQLVYNMYFIVQHVSA